MNPYDQAQVENYDEADRYDQQERERRRAARKPYRPTTDANDFLMGGGPTDPEPDDDDSPPFITAKYDGRCSACEEFHILEGITRIRADGNDGWEAEECAW